MVTYQFKMDGLVRIGSSPANLFIKALYTVLSTQVHNLKRHVFRVWINKPYNRNSILHETTYCFPRVGIWKHQLEQTVRCHPGRRQSWCQHWRPQLTTFRYPARSLSTEQHFVLLWRFLQGARVLVGYRSAASWFLAVVEMTLFSLPLEANIGEIREQKLKWAFNGNEIVWATEQRSHSSVGASVLLPELGPSATRRHITNTPSVPQPLKQALCHLG